MSKEKKQTFLGGTVILAAAVALVKVIGALYKIPLGNILGTEGMTHFKSAYNIYSVLLAISTAGLPLAVSKMVSEARALGRYRQSRKILRVSMWLFVVLGAFGTGMMLFFTEPLAEFMNDSLGYWPIKALSFSVISVCIMSAYRGYTQGQGNMVPSAVSQIIEAAFKLIVGLLLAWYFISLGLGLDMGAAGAILGVTIGSVIAMLYMFVNHIRSRRDDPAGTDRPDSSRAILRQLLVIGIPITIGSSGMSIISTLDQSIALGRLQEVLGISEQAAAALYGEYDFGMTLFNFPSSFIPPITMSLIPAVAAAAARRDHRTVNRVVSASFRIIALLALPAGIGLSVMAGPILKMLYPAQPEAAVAATYHLQFLGIASIFVCLMLLTNGILQAHNRAKIPIVTMFIGGAVKLTMNYILIVGLLLAWYFISLGLGLDMGAAGAILGVTIGSVIAMLYMFVNHIRSRRDDPAGTDRPDSSRAILRQLLVIGIPITIGSSGMSIISTLDQSIALGRLQEVLGISEQAAAALYGEYDFGMTLFNFPSSFIPPITMSLIPAVAAAAARRDHRTVNRVVSASFRIIALLALPAGIGLSVMAGPILKMLYPAQPEAAVAATYHLQFLGIASIFVCLMLLTNGILQAHNRAKIPIVTMFIGGAVKLTMNYILIGNPNINIKGAPIGTLTCYVLISAINLAVVYAIVEEKPRYLHLFGKPLAASLLMGASAWASYGLFSRVFGNTLSTMGAIGVAVVVYLVLVVALQVITREDLEMIPKGDKLAKILRIK